MKYPDTPPPTPVQGCRLGWIWLLVPAGVFAYISCCLMSGATFPGGGFHSNLATRFSYNAHIKEMDCVHDSSSGSAAQGQQPSEGRELEFVSYTSSPLEQKFLDMLPDMNFGDDYCKFVNDHEREIRIWITGIQEVKKTGKMYLDNADAEEVFSVYEFRYKCNEKGHDFCSYRTMIEPLAFFLRHPVALCTSSYPDSSVLTENKDRGLFDEGYLFIATSEQTDFAPKPHTHMDLGAMVRGPGEPHFLIKTYEAQGVSFDRMLMWEGSPLTGEDIFKTIPERWYHAIQYFNVFVSDNTNSEAHPLQLLKRVHPGTGFVAFKLDIDNSELENAVVQKFLEWHDQYPAIRSGQFEFFFEQHVNFELMRPSWKHTIDQSKTLADSYELFLAMRKLGMRSHGWF